MFVATVLDDHDYDCPCMLTASRLSAHRNCVKLFKKEGPANKSDIKQIIAVNALISEMYTIPDGYVSDNVEDDECLQVYSGHLRNMLIKN